MEGELAFGGRSPVALDTQRFAVRRCVQTSPKNVAGFPPSRPRERLETPTAVMWSAGSTRVLSRAFAPTAASLVYFVYHCF